MPVIHSALSVPLSPNLSGLRVEQAQPSGPSGARTAAPAEAAAARMPPVLPVWPDRGAVNLAGELLDLSHTTIAYTATITLPETGADFWAMLATALPQVDAE